MRNANPAFLTALANAPSDGLDVRRFMYFTAKTRTDPPEAFTLGLWTGDDDITVNVTDGQTGSTVNRTYFGVGMSLKIPKIPRISDFSIITLEVKISQLNIINQILVRENNVRFAKVDIHEGIISPITGVLTSPPEIAFLGEVDGDPIETPEAGGEGSISIEIVSDAIRTLTRINPAKRSYVFQHERLEDDFGIYGNVTEPMKLPWGETTAGGPDTSSGKSGGKGRN